MEVLFIELWRSKNYHLFFTLNGNLAGYKIIFWPFPEDSKDMLPLYCSSDCLREKPKGRLTFYFCRWVDFLSLATGFLLYLFIFEDLLLFLIYLVSNWRVIALQNFVVFSPTSTRISHRYTYIPSLLNLLPISLPIPCL